MFIDIDEFKEIDIRIGVVQLAKKVKYRKNNYIKLEIDFGPDVGIRTSVLKESDILSADLCDRQVVGVTNIKAKKITGVMSDVLVLGADNLDGNFVLLVPNREARIGSKIY